MSLFAGGETGTSGSNGYFRQIKFTDLFVADDVTTGPNTPDGAIIGIIARDIDMSDNRTLAVDPKLLEILVCPLTKGPLILDRENSELISKSAGLAFPIRNGIPIMLLDEARELDETHG